jgi:hypothetical protein
MSVFPLCASSAHCIINDVAVREQLYVVWWSLDATNGRFEVILRNNCKYFDQIVWNALTKRPLMLTSSISRNVASFQTSIWYHGMVPTAIGYRARPSVPQRPSLLLRRR